MNYNNFEIEKIKIECESRKLNIKYNLDDKLSFVISPKPPNYDNMKETGGVEELCGMGTTIVGE